MLYKDKNKSTNNVTVTVDSWNNIIKYTNIKMLLIFDEQRVIGNGVWVKSFLKLLNWILLTATPGDTWMITFLYFANNFYKNRTDFIRRHVIYKSFSRYPKVERYVEVSRLINSKKLYSSYEI